MANSAYIQGAGISGIVWPWNPTGPQFAYDIDLVDSQIKNALFTIVGEHKMEPTFGSNLMTLVFETMGRPIESLALLEIRKTLSRWVPYVSIISVLVSYSDKVDGLVTIDVDYMYQGQQHTSTVNITSTSGGGL